MKHALLLSTSLFLGLACHPSQPWTVTVATEDTSVESIQLIVEFTYTEGSEDLGDGRFLIELVDGQGTLPNTTYLTEVCSFEPQGIARVSRGFQEPELGTLPWDVSSSFDGGCAARPIVMAFEVPAAMTAVTEPAE